MNYLKIFKTSVESAFNFQILVQSEFLNKKKCFIFEKMNLNTFEKYNMIIDYDDILYVYDCNEALNFIQKNSYRKKQQILFHFLQPDHFAFNSMIFNKIKKVLVLIKITFDKEECEYYELLWNFMKLKATNENKLKYKKYADFFQKIKEKNLANEYIFQWLTNENYVEIKKKIENFHGKYKKAKKKFPIYHYYQQLIDMFKEIK